MVNELEWLLTLVVGIILPPFVEYLDRRAVSKTARIAISWSAAFVVALVWAWYTDRLGLNWPTAETVGVILMATQTAYDRVWKPLGASAGGAELHKILTFLVFRRAPTPRPQ